MKKYRLAAALAAVLLFSGCGNGPLEWLKSETAQNYESSEAISSVYVDADTMQQRQDEFRTFLVAVNQKRQALYNGEKLDFPPEWAGDSVDPLGDFTEEEMTALAEKPSEAPEILDQKAAAADIHTLFRLLRQGYAAYDYFGGDAVFSPAEEQLLTDLSGKETVSCEELAERISRMLKTIVTDNHLTIKGILSVEEQRRSYYVPDLFFDEPPENVDVALIKRGVNREGKICYILATSLTEKEYADLPKSIRLSGKEVSLSWEVMAEDIGEELAVAVSELPDKTPVLISRMLDAYDEKASVQLDALSRVGGSFGEEPLLIWDLRSNDVGSDSYFKGWLDGFAGNSPKVKVAYAGKITPLNRYLLNFILSPGWYVDSTAGEIREHDGIVLAMQDDFTASAGEGALNFLRALENTVLMGSCTSGTMLTGNCVRVYLPNSGLPVQWGTKLQQIEVNRNPDGAGWEPDLWIPSADISERVEKMIAYYDLQNIQL